MKFIKLTEALSNDETRVAMINFEYVQCFGNGTKGKDTHVRLYDKSFFFVKETVEEIAKLLEISNYNLKLQELSNTTIRPVGLNADDLHVLSQRK